MNLRSRANDARLLLLLISKQRKDYEGNLAGVPVDPHTQRLPFHETGPTHAAGSLKHIHPRAPGASHFQHAPRSALHAVDFKLCRERLEALAGRGEEDGNRSTEARGNSFGACGSKS